MTVLNLGCGSRTSPSCINIDWLPYLRLKRSRLGSILAPMVLKGERRERFEKLADTIVVHDLRKPLPFGDGTVDAVYHSHVLEHLDRHLVGPFFAEVRRVLRVDGVQRVVVPDFEKLCRRYLSHLDSCADNVELKPDHDAYVAEVIEQMVRREASGTSQQPKARRFVENRLRGDARRQGETHQWMYDRVNLEVALNEAGFRDVQVVDHRTSSIPGWDGIRLDEIDSGEEYKRGSLYVEARK